jgi:hypothetical protein
MTPWGSCARLTMLLRASFRRTELAVNRPAFRRHGRRRESPESEAAVDGSRFDSVSRLVGAATTRRTTLRSAVGAAAASTVALVGLAALSGETDAADRRRRRRCRRCRGRGLGEACSRNDQCCTNETNRICALNTPSATTTVCCNGTGVACSINADCCHHFQCSSGFCRMT